VNADYIMATNMLTAVILMKISKIEEAKDFLIIVEKMIEFCTLSKTLKHNYILSISLLKNICITFIDGPFSEGSLKINLLRMKNYSSEDVDILITQHW
jgi:hypothetical protein